MNELVFMTSNSVKGEPFTTNNIIAQYAGVQHHTITRIIRNHLQDFEEFGILGFEEIKGRGQPEKLYQLNGQQATLLITYLKNTASVRAFKKELVRQFYTMRIELFRRRSEREILKPVTADMADKIKAYLPESPNKSRQYCNFINLSYRLAFGKSAKEIRQERGAARSAYAAEFLTSDELHKVEGIQGQIAVLLELGMTYAEIKERMSNRPAVVFRAG